LHTAPRGRVAYDYAWQLLCSPAIMHAVTLIAGDGIGPEIAAATRDAVDATGARIRWEEALAGADALREFGDPLPDATVASIRKNKVALKGPTFTSSATSPHRRVGVAMRQELELFAHVRRARSLRGVDARADDVDVMFIRENAQGLHAGLEHVIDRNSAESLAVLTREGCERFLRFAFEHAKSHGRHRVALVHKQSLLRVTSQLFLDAARQVARQYPRLVFEEVAAEACCDRLVRDPARFDVLVTSNLFCDTLGDVAAGLVGGFGVVPGAGYGDSFAVFETLHGPAADLAGRGVANPAAMMLAATALLEHLGMKAAAARLKNGVETALRNKRARTPDLGGSGNCQRFAAAVVREIRGE